LNENYGLPKIIYTSQLTLVYNLIPFSATAAFVSFERKTL